MTARPLDTQPVRPELIFRLLNEGKSLAELRAEREAYEHEKNDLCQRLRAAHNTRNVTSIKIEGPLDFDSDLGICILKGWRPTKPTNMTPEQRIIYAQAAYHRAERDALIEMLSASHSATSKRKAESDISDLLSEVPSIGCTIAPSEQSVEAHDLEQPDTTPTIVDEQPAKIQRVAYRLPAMQSNQDDSEEGECTDDEGPPLPAPEAAEADTATALSAEQNEVRLRARPTSPAAEAGVADRKSPPSASPDAFRRSTVVDVVTRTLPDSKACANIGANANATFSPYQRPQNHKRAFSSMQTFGGAAGRSEISSRTEDRSRRQVLCSVITAFCPLLARPATDITFAELMELPRQWEMALLPLRYQTGHPTELQIRQWMPKFDSQDELALIMLFGMKGFPKGQQIAQPEKEVVHAVQLLREVCLLWNGLLRGGTGSLADLAAHRCGPTPAGITNTERERCAAPAANTAQEATTSPAANIRDAADPLSGREAQEPQATFVTHVPSSAQPAATVADIDQRTDTLLVQSLIVSPTTQECACAEIAIVPAAHASGGDEGDDDIPFYADIMAAALF